MINRICISINNRCNLRCLYCHFHEKGEMAAADMDVFRILDNVKAYAKDTFKIGFVGNGEGFLDWPLLRSYIQYLDGCPLISVYTITNGTVRLSDDDWRFLEERRVNVGFSLDGYLELHDLYRRGSYARVMENVENYKRVTGHYPTFNATVSKETLENAERVIDFFRPFGTRVTFSRMIGKYGISLNDYRKFLSAAEKEIPVRRGGKDCTMYGGECGAGTNNYFFANGKVYYCGNCIDLPPVADSGISFFELEKISLKFDRSLCYRETLCA